MRSVICLARIKLGGVLAEILGQMERIENRHRGDSRELDVVSVPPGAGGVRAVWDVLLVPDYSDPNDPALRTNPPAGDPRVDLGRGLLLVERLASGQNELVMHSCKPRGHFFIPAFPFGVGQAYVRGIDLDTYERNPYGWDPEGVISVAYKLSRLVRDNNVSTEYAARVVDYGEDRQQVFPGPVGSESATAYRAGVAHDWLDRRDATSLRRLCDAYWGIGPERITGRLHHSLVHCEASAHCAYAEDAVREVVTGLEALLKTGRYAATAQFVQRVPVLAQELGFKGVTRRLCEQVYRWRSQVSHGARTSMFSSRAEAETPAASVQQRRTLDKALLIQTVLRTALARALLDPSFRRLFRRRGTIRARWPAHNERGQVL